MNHDGVRSKAEKESLECKFKIVAGGFLELFDLLQQYAPVWYTEEQNKRALAVRRILQKSRGAASGSFGRLQVHRLSSPREVKAMPSVAMAKGQECASVGPKSVSFAAESGKKCKSNGVLNHS